MSEQQSLYDVIGHVSQFGITIENHTTGRPGADVREDALVALIEDILDEFVGNANLERIDDRVARLIWASAAEYRTRLAALLAGRG